MHPPISPPTPHHTLPPLLASLPAAAVSSQPPPALLPLLSPILRQRVQVLSSANNTEPWLPLLCYDSDDAKVSRLSKIAKSEKLEPHPISGEVEVDWDSAVDTRFRRLDEETLHALVLLRDFDLAVKHVWCENDHEGGGTGWRVGEVNVFDQHGQPDAQQWGYDSIGEAEGRFKESQLNTPTTTATSHSSRGLDAQTHQSTHLNGGSWQTIDRPSVEEAEEEGEDDDAYWAQYDNTPARTPAIKRSPAPDALRNNNGPGTFTTSTASATAQAKDAAEEDAYFSQYAHVQPALDDHDPDEAQANGHVETTLGHKSTSTNGHTNGNGNGIHAHPTTDHLSSSDLAWAQDQDNDTDTFTSPADLPEPTTTSYQLAHPRPSSSSSSGSGGSLTVARLEREAAAAAADHHPEFGIKQHISTSVKSLYRLAQAAGIDRSEFERLVRTELDCLELIDV